MSVLTLNELESAINQPAFERDEDAGPTSPVAAGVVLIYGEEMLVKSALKMLVAVLVPEKTRSVSYEPVDGTAGNLHEALEKVCTYPLLGGRKVVALVDARLFESRKNAGACLKKAREAYESEDLKKAAGHLLDFMALTALDLDDLTGPDREANLPKDLESKEGIGWLDAVVSFCRHTGRKPAPGDDTVSLLEKTIERGVPAGNRLILTTDAVDKRKKIYELIKEKGAIIDCSVPKGERKADKTAQRRVLLDIKDRILKPDGKTMEPGAFELLHDMTGFEPRVFSGSLEKLVTYTGSRDTITRKDVQSILERTRQDPIFAFTSAVTDRNTTDALFYLESLLHDPQQPIRPEQIIVAIHNQVRKLLRIKEFLASPDGNAWSADCTFGQFRAAVLPKILEFDRHLLDTIGDWRQTLATAARGQNGAEKAGKKIGGKAKTDLSIAPNPRNPYPIYQLFKKAEGFSASELRQAVGHLSRSDRQIKSGAENKRLILEHLIIIICGGIDAIDKNRLHHRAGQ